MGAVCRSQCRLSGSSQSVGDFPRPSEDSLVLTTGPWPMGIISWFSLFNFSWLRRCKTCGVRGSKCLCRRPSLALEHIFFLEERKNKLGARNFSHVSDSMMTSNSTMMTSNSTMFATSSTNNNLSNSTVLLRGAGDSDVNPTDYYYGTLPPSNASDDSAELLTPRMDKKNQVKKHRSLSRRENNSMLQNDSPIALVRKQSRRMTSKARHKGDKNMQPPIKEIVTGEYILYSEENTPVSLPMRQQHNKQIVSRRRSREQSKSATVSSRPQYKEEPGVTFQFYGRSGSGHGGAPVMQQMSSNRSISMSSSSSSTNDSFVMRSTSISSTRVSQYSDRVSLETNFGSLNPQSTVNSTGAGRFIDSGYAPSIQEDDEAQVLEQLNGWLNASSVSTQDSFLYSR